MNNRSKRHCLCKFCQGKCKLTRSKIQQHVKIYGLWNTESNDDKLDVASKRLRADDDTSSSSSDSSSNDEFDQGLPLVESIEDNQGNLEINNQDFKEFEFESRTPSPEVRLLLIYDSQDF